jgi:hypothetical protein
MCVKSGSVVLKSDFAAPVMHSAGRTVRVHSETAQGVHLAIHVPSHLTPLCMLVQATRVDL